MSAWSLVDDGDFVIVMKKEVYVELTSNLYVDSTPREIYAWAYGTLREIRRQILSERRQFDFFIERGMDQLLRLKTGNALAVENAVITAKAQFGEEGMPNA